MKEIVGVTAIILAFVAYVPYVRDIIKGKTKPHVYSWFVWGLAGLIIFALQILGGAGIGAYVTLSAALISLLVFVLGLRNGKKDITKLDTIFFITALLSLSFWIFANQPVVSVILLTAVDIFGFLPTVRKSWNKPFEETLFTWALNTFRYGLSIYALYQYNMLTLFYPTWWFAGNLLFTIMLVIRRHQLKTR